MFTNNKISQKLLLDLLKSEVESLKISNSSSNSPNRPTKTPTPTNVPVSMTKSMPPQQFPFSSAQQTATTSSPKLISNMANSTLSNNSKKQQVLLNATKTLPQLNTPVQAQHQPQQSVSNATISKGTNPNSDQTQNNSSSSSNSSNNGTCNLNKVRDIINSFNNYEKSSMLNSTHQVLSQQHSQPRQSQQPSQQQTKLPQQSIQQTKPTVQQPSKPILQQSQISPNTINNRSSNSQTVANQINGTVRKRSPTPLHQSPIIKTNDQRVNLASVIENQAKTTIGDNNKNDTKMASQQQQQQQQPALALQQQIQKQAQLQLQLQQHSMKQAQSNQARPPIQQSIQKQSPQATQPQSQADLKPLPQQLQKVDASKQNNSLSSSQNVSAGKQIAVNNNTKIPTTTTTTNQPAVNKNAQNIINQQQLQAAQKFQLLSKPTIKPSHHNLIRRQNLKVSLI